MVPLPLWLLLVYHVLPVDVAYGVAFLCGVGNGVPVGGFVSSFLVALAAGDAGVVDGVCAAPRVWGDVVGFGAGWLECGAPCEGGAAVGAVGLSGCPCEVEDSCAPFFVAGGSCSCHGVSVARAGVLQGCCGVCLICVLL